MCGRRGCGCCSYCQCSGKCNKPDFTTWDPPAEGNRSSSGSKAFRLQRGDSALLTAIENLPHPHDMISTPAKKGENQEDRSGKILTSSTSGKAPQNTVETASNLKSHVKEMLSETPQYSQMEAKKTHNTLKVQNADMYFQKAEETPVLGSFVDPQYPKNSSMILRDKLLSQEKTELSDGSATGQGFQNQPSDSSPPEEIGRGPSSTQNGNDKHSPRMTSSKSSDGLTHTTTTTCVSLGPLKVTRTHTYGENNECTYTAKQVQDKLMDLSRKSNAAADVARTTLKQLGAYIGSETKELHGSITAPISRVESPSNLRNDWEYGSLYAVRKFTVHHAAHHPNTLHFVDWSKGTASGEPRVTYRIAANAYQEHRLCTHQKTSANDWLIDSHENGSKFRENIFLGDGRNGPALYEVVVKKGKIDKFAIRSTQSTLPLFHDSLLYERHENTLRVFCKIPTGRKFMWQKRDREDVMRLYGGNKNDQGKVYGEARTQSRPYSSPDSVVLTKKETQIFFYNPLETRSHPAFNSSVDQDMDYGYLCATWWCARQIFDEASLAAAHAEAELIENIERGTFEMDLLGGV